VNGDEGEKEEDGVKLPLGRAIGGSTGMAARQGDRSRCPIRVVLAACELSTPGVIPLEATGTGPTKKQWLKVSVPLVTVNIVVSRAK
jgi:hypothetical protein